eukprot:TRINITY_DN17568_c0_g1_i1.p1 TRINITY_DN17568_c0_g1~~TRINITY_DN17568_c0_g1_i1.p1  ORF type:complete len:361 (-),score=43.30 TRINITY_DN17568_c0_g1_i1:95-1177(-)
MEAANSSFDQDKRKLAEFEGDGSSSGEGSGSAQCYNSKTGEILGRTFRSWCKLFSFFGLFSGMIVIIWGLFMGIFFQTIDLYIPKLRHESSLIWDSPGLGYRPAGGLGYQTIHGDTLGESIYSSLIWFRHGGDGNFAKLRKNLDEFLSAYKPGTYANQGATLTGCDFESEPIGKDQSCEFNIEWLSHQGQDIKCISAEHYGYYFGKPCMLLKMNRVYDWRPDPYTIDEVRNHTTMPKMLKADIEQVYQEKCSGKEGTWGEDQYGLEKPCPYLNMVWLHCDGENHPDKENIGRVTYTPWRGFPGYYFPYRNQIGYLSPVVMVQLKNPAPGVIMNIQCSAWARNIGHRKNRNGMVHFEFLMD